MDTVEHTEPEVLWLASTMTCRRQSGTAIITSIACVTFALGAGMILLVPNPISVNVPAGQRFAAAVVAPNGPIPTALTLYRLHQGDYPTSLEALSTPGASGNGPYIEDVTRLKDPWGELYQYRAPGVHHPDGYDLWSTGADRLDGTQDDVGNWQN